MDFRRHLFVLSTAILCGLALPSVAQMPPPNDDYENRTQLTGTSIIFSGTTVGATAQPDELNPNPSQNFCDCGPICTVWWTWTAPVGGQVSIDLTDYTDSRIRTYYESRPYIAIWTAVDWPNRTGQNDYGVLLDLPGRRSITFTATSGTTYDIQFSSAPYGSFTLRLIQTNAPVILDSPHDRLVSVGSSTFFGVVANGLSPYSLSYQWRFNGTALSNETAPILSLDNIDPTMAGSYTVIVSNNIAAVESRPAVLMLRTNEVLPVLSAPSLNADGTISFGFTGQALTSYRIESSSNLVDWITERSMAVPLPYRSAIYDGDVPPVLSSVLFNTSTANRFTLAPTSHPKFVRVQRYVPSFNTNNPEATLLASEICINNLRKIRFAKELRIKEIQDGGAWLWRQISGTDVFTDADISDLIGRLPSCPLETQQISDPESRFYASYNMGALDGYPSCVIDPYNHVLEEPPDNQ